MKIGILGGTFDPVHLAHIDMAIKTYESLKLDEIWFMPSFNPPHKNSKGLSPYIDRKRMLELALKPYHFFRICTIEEEREEASYTSISLKLLKEKFTDNIFFFIMGADSFFNLETWYEFRDIFNLAEIVVLNRFYNSNHSDIKEVALKYKNLYNAKIHIIDFDKNISSSQIRKDIATSKLDKNLLDKNVCNYIEEHKLYK